MTTIYEELKKMGFNDSSNYRKKYYDSSLLKDIKDGKKPETKHITLDHFFKNE